MPNRLVVTATLLLTMALAAPGFAGIIVANSAGPLPASAQDLTGLFPTEILGTLDFPDGVSMFKIQILNPLDFSAITLPLPFGVPDPELFLFNSSGLGVYGNDDQTASNTQSCLPSGDANNPCPSGRGGLGPTIGGTYYLAITRSANAALSNGGNIFSAGLSTDVVGPDPTMGGSQPIIGWDNNVFTSSDFDLTSYDIKLTGTTPEPATWMLAAGALLMVALLRRRLRVS